MTVLYNEFDPYAAQWLRNLIASGEIAPGDVCETDMWDLAPDDLRKYTQVHFCAGIGAWSYAFRRAGFSDTRRVWSASLPCQPFSAAGKGLGFADERHLLPAFMHLVGQCRPPVVCGEQVASRDGMAWLDALQAEMEALDYAFWAVVVPIAGIGGPHERHRTWWVGLANPDNGSGGGFTTAHGGNERNRPNAGRTQSHGGLAGGSADSGMADPECGGREQLARSRPAIVQPETNAGRVFQLGDHLTSLSRVGDAIGAGLEGHAGNVAGGGAEPAIGTAAHGSIAATGVHGHRPGPVNRFWADADWLFCTDGKWRPVEPGTRPLAYGLPRGMGADSAGLRRLCDIAGVDFASALANARKYRVGALKGYGNAICPEVAEQFIRAWIDYASEDQ